MQLFFWSFLFLVSISRVYLRFFFVSPSLLVSVFGSDTQHRRRDLIPCARQKRGREGRSFLVFHLLFLLPLLLLLLLFQRRQRILWMRIQTQQQRFFFSFKHLSPPPQDPNLEYITKREKTHFSSNWMQEKKIARSLHISLPGNSRCPFIREGEKRERERERCFEDALPPSASLLLSFLSGESFKEKEEILFLLLFLPPPPPPPPQPFFLCEKRDQPTSFFSSSSSSSCSERLKPNRRQWSQIWEQRGGRGGGASAREIDDEDKKTIFFPPLPSTCKSDRNLGDALGISRKKKSISNSEVGWVMLESHSTFSYAMTFGEYRMNMWEKVGSANLSGS